MTKNTSANGIDFEIIQPDARIEQPTIQGHLYNEDRVKFYETEKKTPSGLDLISIL